MIPSVLAQHVEQGIKDFLRTTFPVTTPCFSNILNNFLNEPGNMFKGPYLNIQLPFQQGSQKSRNYFSNLTMPFTPYLHQEKAFNRLFYPNSKSTIIATGTGSGKTECFLYPVLDYCYQHKAEPGIKAVLIYPMNALATDQAGRLAKLIFNSKLKNHVTAGIYVGQREQNPSMFMTREKLISNKETLRLSPPDILLTNYKMLDYLLTRPDDRPLWMHNTNNTLRFLIVDELHTFDGAQGSDLACLIRRLKSRLNIATNELCCIGTSATLGSHGEQEDLLKYASTVFGENFSKNSIISESRKSAGEFLGDNLIFYVDIVPVEKSDYLNPDYYNNYEEYIKAQFKLWFNKDIIDGFHSPKWRIALGEELKTHLFFQNLLKILKGKIYSFEDIFIQLEKVTKEFKNEEIKYKTDVLTSLLALASEARTKVTVNLKNINAGEITYNSNEKPTILPFLDVRIQLWMRELRRMVANVAKAPSLRFADDLNMEQLKNHLPIIHCRECGVMGWSGLKYKVSSEINGNLQDFYIAFFKQDPKVVYLFPENGLESDMPVSKNIAGRSEQIHKTGMFYLCTKCLNVTSKAHLENCPFCEHNELILVYMPDIRVQKDKKQISVNKCPYCNSSNSLTLLGSRAASLTSVMLVQLYSSTYNDDKKLLTFSDNVQDAAHRAGFYNSRTFRFNFRTALQQMVLNVGDGKNLNELTDIFIDYWIKKLDQNRYIVAFLAPDMEWLNDYDYLKNHESLPKNSTLMQNINNRIGWEIISEYGFRARIGRTLEKTGSSIGYLDHLKLENAAKQILESLQNEIGLLRELDLASLIRFLLGIIIHLKNQGGIYISSLSSFIESYGNSYVINRNINWMPNFGSNSKTPTFLTTKKGSRFDQLLSTATTRVTWYQRWIDKCFFDFFPDIRTVLSISKNLYSLIFKILVSHGIFKEVSVKNEIIWCILPEAFKISSNVNQFRCQLCGHNISIAEEERKYFINSLCQRFHCYGRYEYYEKGMDYYGNLYATGDVERIFAKEHTGLLNRTERELLEMEFKANNDNRKPWFPNLLSCTPTLEMGIDIGNLSSLILCSVPPAQTNYLQRIGRAGRRDGNALNLTIANAKPHDLFFFAEPEEMLAGYIDAPGVFLDASAILERQFTAFCFDTWIVIDLNAFLPKKLGQVLNNLKPVNRQKFPHNFIYFIETNQADLLVKFLNLFNNSTFKLSSESINHLEIFVKGDQTSLGSLHHHVMNGMHNKQKERETLRKKVQILNLKIRKKKKEPKDKNYNKDLRDLSIEKSALQGLVKNISDRDTFNFFTDEGLLPNYAFPEAGVMLNSLIYRKKQKIQEGESSYDTWTYEYERPAVSALQELAPANTFYAEGRKVKINQVDMAISEVQTWRFCNNCSHKEIIGQEDKKETCINCGSIMWADAGQKRLMLKMRHVFASSPDKQSRISDDSDDREPLFYNKQMLVEFDNDHILGVYKVDADFPFGFDFLSNVDFCEINFGEKTEIGNKFSIAGVEIPRKGFSLCRICGKVQDGKNDLLHAFTCTARDQESDKNLIDCIYLYRQFKSEAVRILLPVNIISDSNRKLQSFIAAMQLGLKKKFGGKIDHLQTTVHEEPLPDSSLKRKYLILYDTIPGGTGYLKQLMRSENQLMDVLQLSLDTLKSCSCNLDISKDGCYKCLFAYRNSYTMPETSRTSAIDLLAEILSYKDKLIKTGNINDISFNTFIESELEARFLGALKLYHSKVLPLMIKNDLVNGKPGYFLKVGERAYYIEPQVKLNKYNGVNIQSRADFIIRPARIKDKMKPIALFLDGFAYHKDRIGLDMAQRMAIVQTGKFHIWSLSWYDIENKFGHQKTFFEDYLNPATLPSGSNMDTLLKGYGLSKLKELINNNSFDLLIHYLENPDEEQWKRLMFVISLLHLDLNRVDNNETINDWKKNIGKLLPDEIADKIMESHYPALAQGCYYGNYEKTLDAENIILKQYIKAEKQAVPLHGEPLGIRVGCWFNDSEEIKSNSEFQSNWNGFLRLYNYFQFLPYTYFVTASGIKNSDYDGINLFNEIVIKADGSDKTSVSNDWNELKEITDKQFHKFINILQNENWPVPEAGFELTGDNGEIIASAEFGWENLKIAFLTDKEIKYENIFLDLKWNVFPLSEVLQNPDKYMSLKTYHGR